MSKFEVKIIYNGYEDVTKSDDPITVAHVLQVMLSRQAVEDPTAARIRELEERLEKSEASASSERYWKNQAEKKLETLKKEIKEKTDE